ncbi:MAG: putative glycoside hydrolase [Terriglobales bacterium]
MEIRAIYLTGTSAGSPLGRRLAEQWRSEGGNAVVFDAKDNTGPVSFNAPLALASHVRRPSIPNLAAWVNWLHQHGLYVIARMALFQDERMVQEHPELAVRSRATGGVWVEHHHRYWVDPSQPAIQQYNIALAKLVADAGVDEIQFDAIRFPVEGDQSDARFAYQATRPGEPRADFISNFLYRAQQALKPTGVRISIDVFGVMGWTETADLRATGQDIVSLAYYCDVICPMIYPSHFFNHFDGLADPSAHPEHFIQAGMEKFHRLTRGEHVVIRPWLQAFRWHTKSFGPGYVRAQVATERAMNGGGFMLWNAGNIYTAVEQAMPAMTAGGTKYFQGGFPYAINAATPAGAPTAN